MKKLLVFFSIIFILIIAIVFNYNLSYSIDNSNTENEILAFINKSHYQQKVEKINIINESAVGNIKFVLVNMGTKTGYCELKRGLNAKYKIISVTSGFDEIKHEIVKTDNSAYLFIFGKNADKKISSIEANAGGEDFKILVPEGNNFIAYSKIPSWSSKVEDPRTFRIFDNENNDITDKYSIN